jgi:hypothetical protein
MMQRARIHIGDNGSRAVIALYLTPESADDLADVLHSGDTGGSELRTAAVAARVLLGEPVPEPA